MTATNTVNLIGRNTADIEVRKTQSGLSVASFTLAVDGRQRDDTDFITIIVWRQQADFLGQYAEKGCMLSVEGRIKTRSYERDGQKVYVTEVVADDVRILAHNSKKPQNEYSSAPMQTAPQTAQNQPSQPQYTQQYYQPQPYQPSPEVERAAKYGLDISSDDLPF